MLILGKFIFLCFVYDTVFSYIYIYQIGYLSLIMRLEGAKRGGESRFYPFKKRGDGTTTLTKLKRGYNKF